MQGILLSGGSGSRLSPITNVVSKQLLPVFDKPLIYYPLSTLILSGVRNIVVIVAPDQLDLHKRLLGNGSEFGLNICYAVQEQPLGIPDAFTVAHEYLDSTKPTVLCLGDNFFYGTGLGHQLLADYPENKALCFTYEVSDPSQFGVMTLDRSGNPLSIVEKPSNSQSNMAIPGLYVFPKDVFEKTKNLKPSERGELEITTLLQDYLSRDSLEVRNIPRGTAWLDTGTPTGLLNAAHFVSIIQTRQGLLVGSPHEAAYRTGIITAKQLQNIANIYTKSDYGKSLSDLAG